MNEKNTALPISEVYAAVLEKGQVFRSVMVCRMASIYWCFEGSLCLYEIPKDLTI